MIKLNVYAKEGTGSRENPVYLIPAKVYLDGEYVGETGTGKNFKGGGLNGISIPEGKTQIDVKVVRGGQSVSTKRDVHSGIRLYTLIFNFTTGEVDGYRRMRKN